MELVNAGVRELAKLPENVDTLLPSSNHNHKSNLSDNHQNNSIPLLPIHNAPISISSTINSNISPTISLSSNFESNIPNQSPLPPLMKLSSQISGPIPSIPSISQISTTNSSSTTSSTIITSKLPSPSSIPLSMSFLPSSLSSSSSFNLIKESQVPQISSSNILSNGNILHQSNPNLTNLIGTNQMNQMNQSIPNTLTSSISTSSKLMTGVDLNDLQQRTLIPNEDQKKNRLLSTLIQKMFAGTGDEDLVVDDMPLNNIRKLVARQMTMSIQLILQMLLMSDNSSDVDQQLTSSLLELNNLKDGTFILFLFYFDLLISFLFFLFL